jgi:hypothetical protein
VCVTADCGVSETRPRPAEQTRGRRPFRLPRAAVLCRTAQRRAAGKSFCTRGVRNLGNDGGLCQGMRLKQCHSLKVIHRSGTRYCAWLSMIPPSSCLATPSRRRCASSMSTKRIAYTRVPQRIARRRPRQEREEGLAYDALTLAWRHGRTYKSDRCSAAVSVLVFTYHEILI